MHRLLRDTRGSVFVEALVYIPFLALIWVLLNHVQRASSADLTVQRDARSCSWHYATRGCTGSPPPGCGGADGGWVRDLELRALAGGSFERIAVELPFLAPTLAQLHGEDAAFDTVAAVERPAVLGGSRTVRGHHAMMCNTRTREWELPVLYLLICNYLTDGWCT